MYRPSVPVLEFKNQSAVLTFMHQTFRLFGLTCSARGRSPSSAGHGPVWAEYRCPASLFRTLRSYSGMLGKAYTIADLGARNASVHVSMYKPLRSQFSVLNAASRASLGPASNVESNHTRIPALL